MPFPCQEKQKKRRRRVAQFVEVLAVANSSEFAAAPRRYREQFGLALERFGPVLQPKAAEGGVGGGWGGGGGVGGGGGRLDLRELGGGTWGELGGAGRGDLRGVAVVLIYIFFGGGENGGEEGLLGNGRNEQLASCARV